MRQALGIFLIFLGIIYIWMGLDNSSKIGINFGKSAVIALDPNNNGSAVGVTAADCKEKWTPIPPGEEVEIVLEPKCGKPVWQRMIGKETICLSFDGDTGLQISQWLPGQAPYYKGGHINRLIASHDGSSTIGIGITYK